MPKPILQPPTTIKLRSGYLVLCGREEVEDDTDHEIFKGASGIISAAGARTEPYTYCCESNSFSKYTVPVCFAGRERNRARGAVQVAASATLKSGGTVVPLL